MKLIIREHTNSIASVKKKEYTVTINAINDYAKIANNVGQMKGDVIVYRSAGDPTRLPVGTNGQVLTADNTAPLGVKWTAGGSGGGGSSAVTLHAPDSIGPVPAYSIVCLDGTETDGVPNLKLATISDAGVPLYITQETVTEGGDVLCMYAIGAIATVRFEGTVAAAVGDAVSVSAETAGVGVANSGHAVVGYAVMPSSEDGTVQVRLTGWNTPVNGVVPFTNASSDALLKGELVVLSTTTANAVERCPVSGIPIGVVASGSIEAGAVGQIATVNGSVVEAKCTADAVAVGDMLTASWDARTSTGTAGQAAVDGNSHNAYGVGYALEAKEAGAVGNVKTLLGVMVKLRNANKWYLADGLTEENVIAAWKFKNVNTLEQALANVNNSRNDYTLTVYGNVTKWARYAGLTFPAEADCYVDCGHSIGAVSCAFGFESMATGSVVTAGTTRGFYGNSCKSYLLAKGGANYKHCMNTDTSNQYMRQNGTIHANGVLACNWPTTAGATGGAMYYNGVKQSTSQAVAGTAYANGWTGSRVFSTASSGTMGKMNLNCLVFYSVNLTDAQHAQIYEQMNALGLAG